MINKSKHFMSSVTIGLLLTLLLTVNVSGLTAKTKAKFPKNPAGKQGKLILNLLNNGERKDLHHYIITNFTEESIKQVSMSRHLNVFYDTRSTYKSFELKSIESSTASLLNASVWSPVTETWFNLRVNLEEKPPHKVLGFNLQPVRSPAKPADKKQPKKTKLQIKELMDTYMERLIKEDIFSGALILEKEGEILFQGAYGLADKNYNIPNRIDTKFNLGAISKVFTAVAVAQLVEKGKLDYEDLIVTHLDGSWIGKDTAGKVKIKHLLSHTSGLGSYFSKKFTSSSKLRFRDMNDYRALVKEDKPRFEPGSRFYYSNTGMLLLGPVIQSAGGKEFYHYIRENIYKPAGMVNSGCFESDRVVPGGVAIGYMRRYSSEGTYWRNNNYDYMIKGGPSGGSYSTVMDLLGFARALRANKLINPESLELLTTNKPELKSSMYGYGFTVAPRGDDRVAGHSGGFPGMQVILSLYIKSDYTYVILSNYSTGMIPVKHKLETLIEEQR
ncbi:MAG: beta-lactamase family protein [bacterium]|nr:beta-lactamase family protein [bacterium]